MAQVTIQQIRDGQGARLDSLSDTQIQHWIDNAYNIVLAHGVTLDNPRFAELQEYKVYDILESTGSIPNEVTSEAVGDTNISFDTNIAIGSAVFWRERFREELHNVLGYNHYVC